MADKPAVPAVPAVPAEPENSYDAMSSVFDTLLDPLTPEGETPPAEVTTPPVEPKADFKPGIVPVKPKDETPPAETPPAETPPAETPPAETPPTEDTELRDRLAALEAKTATPPAAEAPPPVETPPPDQGPPREIYAADEKEFLTAYQKEWPDVSKGEALLRRAEYQQLVTHIFNEVARVYGPLVERGVQAAETVGDTTTLAAIREVHNDYNDAMYEDVVGWADGLTGYRKKLAQGVIAEGEPQDVIDLISEYKSAKGLSKPKAVVVQPTTPATPAVTELSATAKKAAKALGVVDSKRSAATPQGSDPDDFDGAWEEAVGK